MMPLHRPPCPLRSKLGSMRLIARSRRTMWHSANQGALCRQGGASGEAQRKAASPHGSRRPARSRTCGPDPARQPAAASCFTLGSNDLRRLRSKRGAAQTSAGAPRSGELPRLRAVPSQQTALSAPARSASFGQSRPKAPLLPQNAGTASACVTMARTVSAGIKRRSPSSRAARSTSATYA